MPFALIAVRPRSHKAACQARTDAVAAGGHRGVECVLPGRGAACDSVQPCPMSCPLLSELHRAGRIAAGSRALEPHHGEHRHIAALATRLVAHLPEGRKRDRNAAALAAASRYTGKRRAASVHTAWWKEKTVCTIAAHEGALAAIAFNASGSRLASASEKGTVIRVFSVPDGQKLYEFRRGMKRYVTISSLAFSMDSQLLCASSNTETVHIFKLEHLANSQPEEPSTWTSYVGKMFMAATNYLPTQVSDMMNQDRAFATGRLGFSGHRNICTLSTIQKLPRLLVASSSGHLYIYNLDPQDGGDCVLIKTHSLLGSGTADENKENDLRPSLPQSYAATVARPSPSAASTVPGYSEDGGALRGEVIPEHEFAAGPVCLDDENEFPPIILCRGDQKGKTKQS
ncbi:WD repeat domain phosphoinositide-interacting protein 1 isoform 2-T2 [Megaptera novaeangliae]